MKNLRGAHILYGQGNFNFSYPEFSARKECWKTALLVILNVTEKIDIEFIPIYDTGYGCDIAEGEEKEKMLAEFSERNEELLDGRWVDGWERFCHSDIMPHYLNVARHTVDYPDKDEFLAHYLDCEAHLDVF